MAGASFNHPFLLMLGLLVTQTPGRQAGYDPTSAYEKRSIEGFTVLVNRRLLEHPREAREALRELESQLRKVGQVVPQRPLAELRKVRFWVEWERRPDKAAEFHPSEQWLRENGYNPEKAGNIEISNARNFVNWSRQDQPWAAFHELAHSYHFRILGEDRRDILDAYRHALNEHLYDDVEYVRGGKKKAYATTDPKEYFAEISEAYFGRNDFYPFTRDQLRKHDPVGFRLLEEVWGKPRR